MHRALSSFAEESSRPSDGDYQPLRAYAAIGDGRTVALVADNGSIDWLCIPDLDSPSVFGAVLDSARGGRFELQPEIPFDVERSYVPDTNVLQTTFITDTGRVRVMDAMTLPSGLAPGRELVRRIEGLSGRVPVRWSVEPRFGYGSRPGRLERRLGFPVAIAGADAMAICPSSAGDWECRGGRISARFEATEGARAQIVLSVSHEEPLVFPAQHEVNERLESTIAFWREWAGARSYNGPWREAVTRSALALKLLVFAPSGAIAAAATTSLPEELGGERNWDYRYSWVRDSAFTLDAFLRLGCPAEAEAFFWWLMHASQRTHPRLRRALPAGWRRSGAGEDIEPRRLPRVEARSGLATQLLPRRSLMCTATSSRPHGFTRVRGTGSTATSGEDSPTSQTSSARAGGSPTPGYGR